MSLASNCKGCLNTPRPGSAPVFHPTPVLQAPWHVWSLPSLQWVFARSQLPSCPAHCPPVASCGIRPPPRLIDSSQLPPFPFPALNVLWSSPNPRPPDLVSAPVPPPCRQLCQALRTAAQFAAERTIKFLYRQRTNGSGFAAISRYLAFALHRCQELLGFSRRMCSGNFNFVRPDNPVCTWLHRRPLLCNAKASLAPAATR